MNETPFATLGARLIEFINVGTANAKAGAAAHDRPASTDEAFNRLALDLFGLQYAQVLPYRRFCEARGVSPLTVPHWSQLPAVPTPAFKELDLTSLDPDRRPRVFRSSGTSAQRPSRHYHDSESLGFYEASLLPWFRLHLLPDARQDLRFLALTPPPDQVPHSSLAHMIGAVVRELSDGTAVFAGLPGQDGAWTLASDLALAALRCAVEQARPVCILGTTFHLVHLLDDLADRGWRCWLPEGSRVMETGGYKGRSRALSQSELHRLITQGLGIPASHCVGEYGMTELSSQAYDAVAGADAVATGRRALGPARRFCFPPWARTQVILSETGEVAGEGETGLLRVYDLANIRSVLAVQTEDLAVRCGDGFSLLGRVSDAEPRGCALLAA